MALFGRKAISEIRFGFPDDFEGNWRISIDESPLLDDALVNFVWDQLYSKVLYTVGRQAISEGLKLQLEEWAQQHVIGEVAGLGQFVPSDAILIDEDLKVYNEPPREGDGTYTLEVRLGLGGYPVIQTRKPQKAGGMNRFAVSVVALAHHFMLREAENFRRVLPLHILAMKKFYSETPFHKLSAINGAVMAAVRAERELFETDFEADG